MISFNLHYFFKGPICLLKHSHIPKYWGLELSVQSVSFSHSVVSDFLQPHGLQHARLPCPSPSPETYSNSCPLSRWCHPTISKSVVPFSSCLRSSQHRGLCCESVCRIRWPKYWSLKTQILENTIQFIITVIKELDLILNAMGGHGRIAHGVDRVNDFFILPSWVGVCRHYFMSVFLICEV